MVTRLRFQRSPRLRRRYKVTLQTGPCFTIDVGAGGFCAELTRVLQPGTEVAGHIRVDGSEERPFVGRIAWAQAGDAQLALRGRMGVQFTRISPALSLGSPGGLSSAGGTR